MDYDADERRESLGSTRLPPSARIGAKLMRKCCLFLMIFLIGSCSRMQNKDTRLLPAQRQCAALLTALDEYHSKFGRYPEHLDEMIQTGFIQNLPTLPQIEGREGSEIRYESNATYDFYFLRFSYDFEDGFGPGSIYTSWFLSDQGRWRTGKYGPDMQGLAADRAGRLYIQTGNGTALHDAVESLINCRISETGNFLSVSKKQVENMIGPGENYRYRGQDGIRYNSRVGESISYLFTYKETFDPIINVKFEIVDKIYTTKVEQQDNWKLRIAHSDKKVEK